MEADEEEALFKQRRKSLKNGNQLTIGDDKDVWAHGFMVDFEPDVDPLRSSRLEDSMCDSKFWHVIRFSRHESGCGTFILPVDHIFSSDGELLSSRQRDMKSLCKENT